jgi:uncharacterized protein DUF732
LRLLASIIEGVNSRTTRLAAMTAGVVAGALVAVAPAVHASPQNPLPPPPPAPPKILPDPKQTLFMKELNDNGVPYTSVSDAIKMAQSTCQILGSNSPTKVQEAAQRLQDTGNLRPEQIRTFAFAAIGAYCPGVKLS